MFDSSELKDELQALEGEVLGLLNPRDEGTFDGSNNRINALAEQIKAAINELGETLSEQESHVEQFISERPIIALGATFALGVVVGFMMRRH